MSSKCDCCDPFELGENREVISPHSLLFPSLNQNLICEAFDLYHTHRRSNPSHLAHLTSPITSHFSPLLITSQTSLMTPHTSDLRLQTFVLRPQTFVHNQSIFRASGHAFSVSARFQRLHPFRRPRMFLQSLIDIHSKQLLFILLGR